MEEGKGSCSTTPSGSRWNPTKEQIAILEGLYNQGIRTPSAEQIQQITGRLREYGSIEGKNVFYWFQNHKARQRQKQKQESFAYFTRLLHCAQPSTPLPRPALVPFPPAACANGVVCNPYYVPVQQASVVGFPQPPQFPSVLLPEGAMQRGTTPYINFQRNSVAQEKSVEPTGNHVNVLPARHDFSDQGGDMACTKNDGSFCSETLQLFPLHPTGILQEERSGCSQMSPSLESGSLQEGRELMDSATEDPIAFNFIESDVSSS